MIYDCFQDNWCWTDQKFYDILEQFAPGDLRVDQMRKLRTPLENLQKVIRERNKPVQKIQMFFQDMDLRAKMLKELPRRFPDLTITTAIVNNIEFNSGDAHKGAAMLELCRLLDIDPGNAMACGDGLNDITTLQSTGIGVAMDNAPEEVKAVADFITDTNDNDGVVKAIIHFCLT